MKKNLSYLLIVALFFSSSLSFAGTAVPPTTQSLFLIRLIDLNKKKQIHLTTESINALNSDLFRAAWNSRGFGNGKLMELMGGQNFTDKALAKKGDFIKIENNLGGPSLFSHFEGNKICFSSEIKNQRTPALTCQDIGGKSFVFSRITDLNALQSGLDNLSNELQSERAFADVRARGLQGFVKKNSLEISTAETLKNSALIATQPKIDQSLKQAPVGSFADAGAY